MTATTDRPGYGEESAVELANDWMTRQPMAKCGEGGDKQTCKIACGLIAGHGLSLDEARPIMRDYNSTLDEEWSDNTPTQIEQTRIGLFDLRAELTRFVKEMSNCCLKVRRQYRRRYIGRMTSAYRPFRYKNPPGKWKQRTAFSTIGP